MRRHAIAQMHRCSLGNIESLNPCAILPHHCVQIFEIAGIDSALAPGLAPGMPARAETGD